MISFNRLLLTGAAATTAALALAVDGTQPSQPNILLFLVDDMGWQDTSVPFAGDTLALNRRFRTPNMERLAAKGTVFTQAYACSISSPSRCSLMTGMNQARHRVTNWTLEKDRMTDENRDLIDFIIPDWNYNGIQPVDTIANSAYCTPLPELLRNAGYSTIHCGKAHFGSIDTPAADPKTMGFDVNISGHAAGGLASYLGEKRYGHDKEGKPVSKFAVPGLERYWDTDTFVTEALTREAIKALDANRPTGKPFFLHMSHYAVHVPLETDQRFASNYPDLDPAEQAYATLIEGMDKSLGDLMDYLEATDQADNTIVIFMSDNGGLDFAARGEAPDHRHNYPLRSGKGSAYEGGIREPMIVSWNGVTAPGSKVDSYTMIEDFFPSLLEMAGVADFTTVQTVDGLSFVPMLKGEGDPSAGRSLYWNTPNNWTGTNLRHLGIGPTAAVRCGDYKLIYWWTDGRKELYNIKEDISETTDLSASMPDLTKELSENLGSYLRSVDAQCPILKSTGLPAPWPDR